MHVSAIIAAGGRGLRFGGSQPKQLLILAGQPILQRSVNAFIDCDAIDDIVVALPVELLAHPPEYLQSTTKPIEIVEGGDRRQDSVARAFARVSTRADVVIIHDAARPLVSDALIRRTIQAATESGAAIAAIRQNDTVKRANADGMIVETLPRDRIYFAQTPQAFSRTCCSSAAVRGEAPTMPAWPNGGSTPCTCRRDRARQITSREPAGRHLLRAAVPPPCGSATALPHRLSTPPAGSGRGRSRSRSACGH